MLTTGATARRRHPNQSLSSPCHPKVLEQWNDITESTQTLQRARPPDSHQTMMTTPRTTPRTTRPLEGPLSTQIMAVGHWTRLAPVLLSAKPGVSDDSPSVSDGHVESLPDRFDSQGRPLDGRSRSADHWTTRRGTFRRAPQRAGGWDVRGAWEVGGTDSEAVERLVASFTSALDGRRSWTGVLGDVLGSSLMPGIRGVQGGGSRAW